MFWPFGTIVAAPLGVLVLVGFALGILLGMLIHVPYRLRARALVRNAEKRARALESALSSASHVER